MVIKTGGTQHNKHYNFHLTVIHLWTNQFAPNHFNYLKREQKKLNFYIFIPKSTCCQGGWEYPRSLYQSKGYNIYFAVLRPSGMTSLDSCMFSKGQQPNCLLGRIPSTCCFQTGLRQCLRKLQQPWCLCYGQMIYGWSSPYPTPVLFTIMTYLPTYLPTYISICVHISIHILYWVRTSLYAEVVN